VRLREASPQDASDLAELIRRTGAELGWTLSAELESDLQRQLSALAALPADHRAWVIEVGGQVVAFALAHLQPYLIAPRPELFVGELFVHPDHRGAGLGSALLAQAEAFAAEAGCGRISLLNHRERASYTRGFYAEQGYRERETMANFVKVL
tara:strand:+ start:305 stop:760 length:456 start_codon:yes stop_codon:yes gene_type:complete